MPPSANAAQCELLSRSLSNSTFLINLFPVLSSLIGTMTIVFMMLVTLTWHSRPQRPQFKFRSRISMATSPCLIMGICDHQLIILTLIWWFRTLLLLNLPTTTPTCCFMMNECKARMRMRCAACNLRTTPISSKRCLSVSRRCPRS